MNCEAAKFSACQDNGYVNPGNSTISFWPKTSPYEIETTGGSKAQCYECWLAGRTHFVSESHWHPGFTCDGRIGWFCDGDGRWHHHDPSVHLTIYSCICCGKVWQSFVGSACWCGWPHFGKSLVASREGTT